MNRPGAWRETINLVSRDYSVYNMAAFWHLKDPGDDVWKLFEAHKKKPMQHKTQDTQKWRQILIVTTAPGTPWDCQALRHISAFSMRYQFCHGLLSERETVYIFWPRAAGYINRQPDPGVTPNKRKSLATEGKIAELVNNLLIRGFSTLTVKEREEKHPPSENCKYLSLTTVNEE